MSKMLARPCFVRRWAIATLKERGVSIPSSGTKNVDLARLLGIVPATKRALAAAYLCRDKKHEFAYDDSVKSKKASYVSIKIKNDAVLVPVESDAFLRTYEWRKLRMQALKWEGGRCQCCGASASTGAVINVDHVKPRKLFPELALDIENLQVLCHECNHGKGNWDMTDWRPGKNAIRDYGMTDEDVERERQRQLEIVRRMQ